MYILLTAIFFALYQSVVFVCFKKPATYKFCTVEESKPSHKNQAKHQAKSYMFVCLFVCLLQTHCCDASGHRTSELLTPTQRLSVCVWF